MTTPLEKLIEYEVNDSQKKIQYLKQMEKHLRFQLEITIDLLKDNEKTYVSYKEKHLQFKKGIQDIFKFKKEREKDTYDSYSHKLQSQSHSQPQTLSQQQNLLLERDTQHTILDSITQTNMNMCLSYDHEDEHEDADEHEDEEKQIDYPNTPYPSPLLLSRQTPTTPTTPTTPSTTSSTPPRKIRKEKKRMRIK